MTNYTANSFVSVYPFTRQTEVEEIVIGIPENNVFLALPHEAVELLDYLAAGNTIGEASAIYLEKYGELPDLEDLLHGLERRGFITSIGEDFNDLIQDRHKQLNIAKSNKSQLNRYHFANFPQAIAQKIFSLPMLLSYGVIIGLAIVLTIAEPRIIPTWKAYFFKENATLMILAMMAIDFVVLFLHEMAHLIAARSLGIFCRLGISNRMWTIVAQTDMTGIWNIPKQKRYLPLLAGSLIDLVSAAILAIVSFTYYRGYLVIHPISMQLIQAWLLNYMMGLLWQGYFFMRTDFYYVFANFFNCKNLLQDTEVFARNQLSRIFNRIHRIDQSHIPRSEQRVIQLYTILWFFGRIASIGVLIFINLPVMWHYCGSLFTTLSTGYSIHPYAFIDALFLLTIFCLTQGLGLGMWIRSFWKKSNLVNS
jgi:putative peptide zinc metalloprotease protein